MKKFHINDKGEPGPCSAKIQCRFGKEEEHFETKEDAQNFYEKEQSMIYLPKQIKVRKSETTDQAISSDLKYAGRVPRWFKKIPTTLQKSLFNCEPEIIDVIESPIGKLAVVWEKSSVESNDIHAELRSGLRISRLTYRNMKTGDVVAYLKTIHSTPESLSLSYGDDDWRGFRYLAEQESFYKMDITFNQDEKEINLSSGNFKRIKTVNPPTFKTDEEIREFVSTARQKLNITDASSIEGRSRDELLGEIEALKVNSIKAMNDSQKEVQTPIIEFSRVNHPELQGKGAGASLYVYAAKKLSEEDQVLKASTLQTEEAEKVWFRMAADERLPIHIKREVTSFHDSKKISPVYFMDFRKIHKF